MKLYEERKGRLIRSLWEGMMLLGVVFMLSTILAPVFHHAKQRTPLTVCVANMKELGTAMNLYVEDWDGTYPPNRFPKDSSQTNPIAGYAGSPYTWKRSLIESDLLPSKDVWSCPANPNSDSYSINSSFFHEAFGARKISEIKDTTSLLVIVESKYSITNLSDGICGGVFQHKKVSNWTFADGQVRTLTLGQTLRPRYMWRNPEDQVRQCNPPKDML